MVVVGEQQPGMGAPVSADGDHCSWASFWVLGRAVAYGPALASSDAAWGGAGAKCRILGRPFTDYGPGSVPAGARAAPGPGGLAPPGCWLMKKDAAYC